MKNKLLLTTALIGSVALAGTAQSEIKIGGSQEVTFAATSNKTTTAATDGQASGRAIGNETNLNVSGGMKLSNGMDIVSKFNLEFDSASAAKREVSLQLNSGNAYFIIANDFTQGLNSLDVPRVGDHASTIAGRAGTTAYTDGYIENNFDDHFAVGMKVAGGDAVLIYSPNAQLAGNDDGALTGIETGSGYEATYKGSPVAGVTLSLGKAVKQAANTTVTKDIDAKKYGISYAAGKVSAGVMYSDKDTNTTSGNEQSIAYGLTFNAADNMSVGINHVVTEDKDAGNTNPDEKITVLTVGYNWAGLGVELSYANAKDMNHTAGNDADVVQLRSVIAF
jgi:hypothetical protein